MVSLGEPYIYQNLEDFTRIGILLGECLTCEELSGGYLQEMMGLTLPYTRTWGNLQPLGFYLEGVLQSWIIVQLVSLKKFGSDSQMGYDDGV